MLTMLCVVTAWLQLMAQELEKATTSFKMVVIRSVGGWQVEMTASVLYCHRPLLQELKPQQLRASMLKVTARTIVTKRRDEYFESGVTLRSQSRESGKNATSPITPIAHGADIAREDGEPRDLIGRGQKKIESSARGEWPQSAWTVVSSVRRGKDQMVRQSQLSRIHFLLCTTPIQRRFTVCQLRARQ